MLRQWMTARFEELMAERLEVYEAIKEKEQEIERIAKYRKEPPAYFDSIEYYYDYADAEEYRDRQQEQLQQRIGDLKLSLFTSSEDKGIARKVSDHLAVLTVLRNEDDYRRVKERLF